MYIVGAVGLIVLVFGTRWHVRGLRLDSIPVAGKGLAVALGGFLLVMVSVYHLYLADLG